MARRRLGSRIAAKLGAALTWLALIPLRGLEAVFTRLDNSFVEKRRRALEDELRRRGRVDLPGARQVKMADGQMWTMRRCGTSTVRLAQILETRNPG